MYAKVFSQIYDGTLCTNGPWQALVTFQQLLVLADQDGNVDMTAAAIARRTTIPIDIIALGLKELAKPDLESRTPTAEGRRILPLSEDRNWGWSIVNYRHYRELKREEDRREYHKEYWHKRKAGLNNSTQQLNKNSTGSTKSTEAYAEAEEVKTIVAALPLPEFIKPEIWEMFKAHRGKKFSTNAKNLTIKDLIKAKHAGQDPNEMLEKSIANGWKGVFPTKDKPFQNVQPDYMRGVT